MVAGDEEYVVRLQEFTSLEEGHFTRVFLLDCSIRSFLSPTH